MALDIGVGNHGTHDILNSEPRIALAGSYCHFMSPLFDQLQKEIGKEIDPYDYASILGDELAAVERMLERAVEMLATQPESWEICVGTIRLPDAEAVARVQADYPDLRLELTHTCNYKMHETVRKDSFLKVIEEWRIVIARARELKLAMLCLGD